MEDSGLNIGLDNDETTGTGLNSPANMDDEQETEMYLDTSSDSSSIFSLTSETIKQDSARSVGNSNLIKYRGLKDSSNSAPKDHFYLLYFHSLLHIQKIFIFYLNLCFFFSLKRLGCHRH